MKVPSEAAAVAAAAPDPRGLRAAVIAQMVRAARTQLRVRGACASSCIAPTRQSITVTRTRTKEKARRAIRPTRLQRTAILEASALRCGASACVVLP